MSLRAALVVAASMLPTIAHAQDKAACLQAHVHGQELRIAGKWRAARAEFATCSAAACPAALSKDCVGWNAELASKQPTIVVAPEHRGTVVAALDDMQYGTGKPEARLTRHALMLSRLRLLPPSSEWRL